MILDQRGLEQRSGRIGRLHQQYPDQAEDLPDEIYLAYAVIFRDIGMDIELSDCLGELDSYLLVSPVSSTMVVRRDATKRMKVFQALHGIGHLLLGHGDGNAWLMLKDFSDEMLDTPQARLWNDEAGVIAHALLNECDLSLCVKMGLFRSALRWGLRVAVLRQSLESLRKLHHVTQKRVPIIADTVKHIPGIPELAICGRAVLEEHHRRHPDRVAAKA